MLPEKVTNLITNRLRALKMGVFLGRCADFRMPSSIVLNNKRHSLSLPTERGIRIAFMELLLTDCYQLEQVSKPVRTVLDIGANMGLFCLAARRVFPDAAIHAYEPNPHLESYLKVQAEAASCQYFMEAVGQEDGKVSLLLDEDSVLTRSEQNEAGDIPAVAFRKAIQRLGGEADLLKLDCEGAEWELFEDQETWKNVRDLSMEYHLWPNHTHEEVYGVVRKLGFTVQKQLPASDFGLLRASRRDR